MTQTFLNQAISSVLVACFNLFSTKHSQTHSLYLQQFFCPAPIKPHSTAIHSHNPTPSALYLHFDRSTLWKTPSQIHTLPQRHTPTTLHPNRENLHKREPVGPSVITTRFNQNKCASPNMEPLAVPKTLIYMRDYQFALSFTQNCLPLIGRRGNASGPCRISSTIMIMMCTYQDVIHGCLIFSQEFVEIIPLKGCSAQKTLNVILVPEDKINFFSR